MKFKPTRRLLEAVGIFSFLVIVLATAGAFLLPVYVQSRLIPRLAAGFGLAPGEAQVRRIGFWGADLGPIRLDSQQAGVLTLAAVQVDYTPWSLLRGRIDGITLGGVGLALEATPRGLSLAGWEPPAPQKGPSSQGKPLDMTTMLPIRLGHLMVLQSQIAVHRNGCSYIIPLEMQIETAEMDRGILKGQVRLSILGNPLILRITVDQHANQATLHLACDRFLLQALCRSGLLPESVALSGVLDVTGEATLQLDPVAVAGLQISGRLAEFRLAAGRVALENTLTDQGASRPIVFSVTAEGPDQVHLAGGPFRIDGPVRIGATSFKGTFAPGRPDWSLDGCLETLVPRQATGDGFTWEKELPLALQVRLGPAAAETVDFRVNTDVRQAWAMGQGGLRLTGDAWEIQCHGTVSASEVKAEAAWTTGPLQLAIPNEGSVKIPGVKAGGTLIWAMPSNPVLSRASVQALLSDVDLAAGSTAAALPVVRLQAEGRAEPGQSWNLAGRLTLSGGRIQDKVRRLDARGMELDLPLQWPAKEKVPAGRVQLGAMQWEGRRLGGLEGTLQQQGRTIQVRLEHLSKLFEGLRVFMEGSLGAEGFRERPPLTAG